MGCRPVGEVFTIGYRLGIMGDFQLHEGRASILEGEEEEEGEHDMDVWLLIWFFICSALLTLFMMNVVIGVLGESYDIEHDQAHVSFLRSRAAICAEYSSRIWKVQRPVAMYSVLRHGLHLAQKSTPRCLLWLAATMPVSVCYGLLRCVVAEWNCYDYHGRYTGLDTTAPFLWVCLSTEQQSRSRDAEASRMQIMCSRIDNSIYKMQQAIHGGLADAEDKRKADSANIDSMNARMGRMERILTELAGRAHHSDQQHTDAPLRQPSSAPSSIHTCPFSGVSLPAEATATQAHPRPHANGQGTRSEEEASGAEQPEVEGRAGAQPRRADGRKVPADVFFYGPHLASIEEMVMETYGVDAWHSVKEKAGLAEFSDGDFVQSQQYDQNCVVLPIVRAITEELGLGEEQTYHALGTHFVAKYLDRNGYLDMLRMRGKTLREFMDSMDALHVNIEKAYPKGLAFPSFKTSDADVGFLLHYWSFRPGLWPMAAGQVEAIGQVLFGQETMLQVLRQSEEEGVHYVLFQVLHGADVQQQRPRNGEHGMVEEGGRPARAEPDGAGQREAARECPRRPDRQVPPAEERIYGLVNDCVEKLVINRSGRHTWHAIKARAGLVDVQDGDFLKSQQYDQDLLYRLVAASSEELQITMEETLEAAGDFFISEYTPRHGYLKLLQAQGRNLREFMDSMDRMHAHLKRNGHPGLAPPSFKTEDAKGMPGFLLHYWSFRPGLSPMVKGMVRASGRLLFSQETRLEVLKSSEEGGVHYVLFHVAPPLKRHHTRIQLPLTPLPTA